MRRASVVVAVSALVSLSLLAGRGTGAPAQHAGVIVSKDAVGDVRASAPVTVIDRKAIDILGVRAFGADSLGFLVGVTFSGNFENEIGRGGLEDAAAALILEPKSPNALGAGLVTDGPGPFGVLHRETRSTNVGSARDRNRLWFFLDGPGYERVKTIEVVTVLTPNSFPALSPPGASPTYIGSKLWDSFTALPPLDRHVVNANASRLSCSQLGAFLDEIDEAAPNAGAHKPVLLRFRSKVNKLHVGCRASSKPKPKLGATFAWRLFSPDEVAGSGRFTGPSTTFDSLRVVLPAGRGITSHLCPAQLPNAVISGNRIDCGGGALKTEEPFTLNLQTAPVPRIGMGGQLYGSSNGTLFGPFTITGP